MTPARLTFIIAYMGWMVFVLVAFYVVQRPIVRNEALDELADLSLSLQAFANPPQLTTIITIGWACLVTGLNVCAAAALGFPIMSMLCPLRDDTPSAHAERWLLSFSIGLGLMAMASFVLSLFNVWLSLLSAFAPWLWLRQIAQPAVQSWRVIRRVRLPRLLNVFMLLSLCLAFLQALTPPTAWDALVYHLTTPRVAITQGRWLPTFDIIPHTHFPMLMSSLYLPPLLLSQEAAAQLLHFTYGFLTLALVALSARQFYSREAAPWALVLALSMPMLLLLATWAYNDVALAFYTLAALYAYRRWMQTSDLGWLSVAALMVGFAMGLKYTSFVLPLCLVLLIAFQTPPHSATTRWQAILRFALLSLLVASPWYLKNWFFTGNPFYPFIFGGAQWDALRTVWYARAGTGIGFDGWAVVTLPFVATLGYRDANFFDGRTGPLILLLSPLLFLLRHSTRQAVGWLETARQFDPFVVVCLAQYGVWTFGIVNSLSLWQTRLLLPALLLLTPPLAQALVQLARFDHPTFSLRRFVMMVMALVLVMTLFRQALEFATINPLAYLSGMETRAQFLQRRLPGHADAMFAINQLPIGSRVQFMWEPRSYLAQRSVRADPLLDALPHLLAIHGDLNQAVQQLKSEGFTHILVYERGARFAFRNLSDQFTPAHAEALQQLERDYLDVVYENPSYRLLTIRR